VPTSRKICIGVLALALVAFAVDRLFLSSGQPLKPASAVASPVQPAAPPMPPAVPLPAAAAAGGTAPPAAAGGTAPPASLAPSQPLVFSDRLKALAAAKDLAPARVREAFAPSPEWLATLQAPKPVETPVNLGEEFARKHKLTSVLLSGGVGRAIIDGKILTVGQKLDGFTLTGLAPDSATFRSVQDASEVRLPLSSDTARQGGA
jgi:hypothetical protein